jgi:hypothetical protein
MPDPNRFVNRCVRPVRETLVGRPAPPIRKGAGGYGDRVMLTIFCLKDWKVRLFDQLSGCWLPCQKVVNSLI